MQFSQRFHLNRFSTMGMHTPNPTLYIRPSTSEIDLVVLYKNFKC